MKRKPDQKLRKLRILLYRQLKLLRLGLVDRAVSLYDEIGPLSAEVSLLDLDDFISQKYVQICEKYNTEIAGRLQTERDAYAEELFRTDIDQKIREFLK